MFDEEDSGGEVTLLDESSSSFYDGLVFDDEPPAEQETAPDDPYAEYMASAKQVEDAIRAYDAAQPPQEALPEYSGNLLYRSLKGAKTNFESTIAGILARSGISEYLPGLQGMNADEINRNARFAEAELAIEDKDSMLGKTLASGVRSASSSIIGGAPAAAAGGTPLLIAQYGLDSASKAYTQAIDKGLDEGAATRYAILNGSIEAGFTALYGKMGAGGLESMFGGRGHGKFFQNIVAELAEEETILVSQTALAALSGVEELPEYQDALRMVGDTAVATALGVGVARGLYGPSRFVENPSRANAKSVDLPPEEAKNRAKRETIAKEAQTVAENYTPVEPTYDYQIEESPGGETQESFIEEEFEVVDQTGGYQPAFTNDENDNPLSLLQLLDHLDRKDPANYEKAVSTPLQDIEKGLATPENASIAELESSQLQRLAESLANPLQEQLFEHLDEYTAEMDSRSLEQLANSLSKQENVDASELKRLRAKYSKDEANREFITNHGMPVPVMRAVRDASRSLGSNAGEAFRDLHDVLIGRPGGYHRDKYQSEKESGQAPASDVEAMPSVPDIPGSAPKGRFGPLEAEQAWRGVETSAEPLIEVAKPVSSKEVIDAIEKIGQAFGADVPIRGHLLGRARKALGYYMPSAASVRLLARFDMATAAHEIGHAVHYAIGLRKASDAKKRFGMEAYDELYAMGKRLYGDRKPAGGYYNEGVAEFFRYYVARGEDAAKKKAPVFFEKFQQEMAAYPNAQKAILDAAGMVRTWGDQGAVNRVRSQIVDMADPKRKRREAIKKLKDLGPAALRHAEEFEPFRELTTAFEEGSGESIKGTSADPYRVAKATRGRANANLDRMIETEMIDGNGNPTGASLRDALAPLGKKDYDDFNAYLYATRSLAVYNSTLGPRNPGVAKADAEYAVKTLGNDRFEVAANNLYKWWEGVLDYVASVSPEMAENVRKQRERNLKEFGATHGYYVPLSRIVEQQSRGVGSAIPKLSGKLSKQLRGSDLPIREPLPALLARANDLMRHAHRRAVADTMFALYDESTVDKGNQRMARYLEPIPEAVVPVNLPPSEMARKFSEIAQALGLGDVVAEINMDLKERELSLSDVMSELAYIDGKLAEVWLRNKKPMRERQESPIVTRVEGENIRFYRADPKLFEALHPQPPALLTAIRTTPIIKQLHTGIVQTNRMLRAGAVGLRATFAVIKAPFREVQGLAYHTEQSNPLQLAADYWAGLNQTLLYSLSGGKIEGDWMKVYHRLGVQMASPLVEDSMNTRQAAKRALETPKERTLDVRNGFYFIRDVLQSFDAAPRIAEMRRTAREIGWTPDQPITPEVALTLGLSGKEITADFGAGSPASRALNDVFLFYNIAIQGPRATVRSARHHPSRFAKGIAIGTAITLANWWRNKDEDWWLQRDLRDDFANAKVKLGDEVVRIPINQEASQIPQAIMIMVDAAYRRDPEVVTEYMKSVLSLIAPSNPVLLQWAKEQRTNEKEYTGAPIIPRNVEKASPEDQYGPYTSEITKEIGRILSISPARIDHTVRTFGGGLGGDLLGIADSLYRRTQGIEQARRAEEKADLPIVGTLFQRGGIYGTRPRSVTKVFDAYEEAEKRQFSTRKPETEDERQLRLQLLDGKKALTAILNMKNVAKTSEEKRELNAFAVQLSKQVLQDYRNQNYDREYWRGERRYLVEEAELKSQ